MKPRTRATASVAAGVVAAATVTAVVAQPAAASPRDGKVWLFKDDAYRADAHDFDPSDRNVADYWQGGIRNLNEDRFHYRYGGSYMNDSITSIANETSDQYCFYRDAEYRGLLLCVGPYSANPNVGRDANDQISSFRPCNIDC